jgi:pimeloyl-ACP methyl ester carboxylesterase
VSYASKLILPLLAALATGLATPALARCSEQLVDIDSSRLWVDLQGSGAITVVFEAGNGNDSTAWSAVAPRVRAAGVRTLVYDRAGLGKSGPPPASYTIDEEVGRLKQLLRHCEVTGPIILVGASHGGTISSIMAAENPQIRGMVLVDAVIAEVATDAWANLLRDSARPDYADVRKEAPALAAAVIPVVEAMPATAVRLRNVKLPENLPIIDIVADKAAVPGKDTKADADWVAAHAAFAGNGRNREAVLATGSGHKVATDKPDVVVDAIVRMVRRLSALQTASSTEA